MSAVLELPKTKKAQLTLEREIVHALKERIHVVFYDVDYQTYSDLIEKYPERRNPRLTYDRGILEVMPLPEHDNTDRIIETIVDVIAEEFEMDFSSYGASTQNRARMKGGFEPDASFYFGKNAELMRYRDRFLESDPAPDLVVEIDVTHSSIGKFDLMATFGVAEIWMYESGKLKILLLENGEYVEREESGIFPNVTSDVLNRFLESSRTKSRIEWRKEIREWAQSSELRL